MEISFLGILDICHLKRLSEPCLTLRLELTRFGLHRALTNNVLIMCRTPRTRGGLELRSRDTERLPLYTGINPAKRFN